MSVVFFAGLPRSCTLGFADFFYQTIDAEGKRPLLTGHLHLAAVLSGQNLDQFDSPLNLYKSQEALIRCLLNLHGMDFSPDSFSSILKYYSSSSPGQINSQRLKSSIEDSNLIVIDPSFSHSLNPSYFKELPEIFVDLCLAVIWRNPIAFALDIRIGVFAFDCCLHWIMAKKNLTFPLDPLALWLEFVKPFSQKSCGLTSFSSQIYYLHAESILQNKYAEMHGKFSFNDMSKIRESALAEIHPLVTDSPFSGDPSYCIESSMGNSMSVSVEQLALFSTNQSVIDEVAALSKAIGYVVVD
tara:strand:+ start:556 stop:1452 length:897 start_codon:yes stop_codon:yes gene_type:complete